MSVCGVGERGLLSQSLQSYSFSSTSTYFFFTCFIFVLLKLIVLVFHIILIPQDDFAYTETITFLLCD